MSAIEEYRRYKAQEADFKAKVEAEAKNGVADAIATLNAYAEHVPEMVDQAIRNARLVDLSSSRPASTPRVGRGRTSLPEVERDAAVNKIKALLSKGAARASVIATHIGIPQASIGYYLKRAGAKTTGERGYYMLPEINLPVE